MVHEDPTLLEPGRADRDVLGPFYARAAAVSQSVSFTQPLAWGIGSLGRVHHPMKGCSCHHVMTGGHTKIREDEEARESSWPWTG